MSNADESVLLLFEFPDGFQICYDTRQDMFHLRLSEERAAQRTEEERRHQMDGYPAWANWMPSAIWCEKQMPYLREFFRFLEKNDAKLKPEEPELEGDENDTPSA